MSLAAKVGEMYLDNIDEFVEDESAIVTYKWLSFTLQVHVNTAKKMLWEYVRRKRAAVPQVELHVTYYVSGGSTLDGLPCHKVCLVREEDLDSTKVRLSPLVSVHVYSVQRGRLLDSGVLYMADYDIVRENLHQPSRFSGIHYSRGVARSAEEMLALRSRANAATREQSDPLDGPVATPAAPTATTNGQCAPKAAPRAPPPTGIMGMFAGKGGGSRVRKESPAPEPVNEKPAAASVKAPVKVSIFASAAAKAKPKEEIKTEVKVSVSMKEARQAKVDDKRANSSGSVKRPKVSDSEDEEERKPVAVEPKRASSRKGTGNAGKGAAAVRGGKKKKAALPETKKRKRIRPPVSESSGSSGSGSGSDGSDDDDNNREREAPSPPPIETPPLPAIVEQRDDSGSEKTGNADKSGGRRKRRRVLKSNTFVDEEGSIVTEKGWVSESCTDSEGECQAASKKASTAPKAAQKTEGGKGKDRKAVQQSKLGKQTSIMGFFQKK